MLAARGLYDHTPDMFRDMAAIVIATSALVGAFALTMLTESWPLQTCDTYLRSFDDANPAPSRGDPGWERYADYYFQICGIRL